MIISCYRYHRSFLLHDLKLICALLAHESNSIFDFKVGASKRTPFGRNGQDVRKNTLPKTAHGRTFFSESRKEVFSFYRKKEKTPYI